MKCLKCEYKRNIKGKDVWVDYSKETGIDGCKITYTEYTCPKCKTIFKEFEDDEAINRAICEFLCGVEMLNRQCARFVRVKIFNESEHVFAKRIGAHPIYYSEVELLKRPMSKEMSDSIKDELMMKYAFEELGKWKIEFK